MDENNQPLDFSNWGQAYKSNGLLFPGNNILTALPGNDTTLKTGTSFATAVASGIAGLLMSLLVKYGKKPDGKIVFDALINSAFKCKESDNNDCTKSLAGYVNVKSAVRKILAGCNFLSDGHLMDANSFVENSASYITSKKKTHLWNKSTIHNLQLI